MSREALESGADSSEMLEQVIISLADYILDAPVETMPVHGFEHLAQEDWKDFAEKYIKFTGMLGRILNYEERVELIVAASRYASEVHKRERLPGTSEKLQIPTRFRNPNVVSEEGWSYIEEYYEDRHSVGASSAS